jgi:hypothetical protein
MCLVSLFGHVLEVVETDTGRVGDVDEEAVGGDFNNHNHKKKLTPHNTISKESQTSPSEDKKPKK